jgi:hypothetical protein
VRCHYNVVIIWLPELWYSSGLCVQVIIVCLDGVRACPALYIVLWNCVCAYRNNVSGEYCEARISARTCLLLSIVGQLYVISCLAETNRTPFDFAEGESELVLCYPAEHICAELDNIKPDTTTTSAHRPPTFTVHDYSITISAFQVTHKDTRSSLKMAYGCRNM